jgi:archaetidylinositol phosphate synthase
MFLEDKRGLADKVIGPIAAVFRNHDPDTFSWLSLISAVIGGVMFYFGGYFLLLSALFVGLNSIFDLIDGKLAIISKKQFANGSFLDNIFDRYSDMFLLLGVAFSPYCNITLGFIVMIGTLLTSSVGSLGIVNGAGRIRGGFSRADRLAVLFLLPILQYILILAGRPLIKGVWFTQWVMIFLAVAVHFSAIQRAFILWKGLKAE